MRRTFSSMLPAALIAFGIPALSSAQDAAAPLKAASGKWVGTIVSLSIKGSADLTIEPRNDKQSKAKISFRSTANDRQIAWDIVQGRCGEEGLPVAPAAAFRQVRTGLDGQGEATSNIPLLVPGKQYYFRAYSPGEQPTDRGGFGCANINEKP